MRSFLKPPSQTLVGVIGAMEAWGTAHGPAFRQEVARKSTASGAEKGAVSTLARPEPSGPWERG